MSLVAVPESFAGKRRVPWMLTTIIALAVVGVVWLVLALRGGSTETIGPGQYYTITPMDLDITISKDGELQAVNNVEITCPVEGQNTIVDIAKEGDFVHKGDIICRFDSSEIERKIENSTLDVQKAESDLTSSREQKEIQESTNSANLEAANVELVLARLDLQQYVEGTYPSSLQTAQTQVEMAKITVKTKEDDLAQARSLFGKGFVTAVEVKTAEVELIKAKNTFDQETTDLDVLQKYTHEKDLTEKKNKVAQAEKKLARTQRENASNLAQRLGNLQQYDQSLTLRKQQLEHLQEQLAACTIEAPQDGMIVYGSSGSQWGRRDTPIQPGAQVRWQELLIRLPDTSSMKVVCRINEQQASKLRVDPKNPMRAVVKIVGQNEMIGGWVSNISVMADSSQRWWSPDSKDYPVDVKLDYTPAGLKPGVSVESMKIYVERMTKVLAAPLGAVYAAGSDNYVFVRASGHPKPVKVTIGQVNETHAELKSGIAAGDQVLILEAGQGRELLEKAGITIAPPSATTKPIDFKPPQVAAPIAAQRDSEATTRPSKGNRNRGERRPDSDGQRQSHDSATSQPAKLTKTASTSD